MAMALNEVAALTARQANAAFGGPNYKMLGRNKTLQDVMRLSFMAPDFTEARARFVGQAARPFNREQLSALVSGALAFYTAFSTILKMVGVNESVGRTKAEKLAGDIAQSNMSDRALTSEERESTTHCVDTSSTRAREATGNPCLTRELRA